MKKFLVVILCLTGSYLFAQTGQSGPHYVSMDMQPMHLMTTVWIHTTLTARILMAP